MRGMTRHDSISLFPLANGTRQMAQSGDRRRISLGNSTNNYLRGYECCPGVGHAEGCGETPPSFPVLFSPLGLDGGTCPFPHQATNTLIITKNPP